jgi:hypothetical protein
MKSYGDTKYTGVFSPPDTDDLVEETVEPFTSGETNTSAPVVNAPGGKFHSDATGMPETGEKLRKSTRTKAPVDRYIGNTTTVNKTRWGAFSVPKLLLNTVLLAGVLFLPNTVVAEPTHGFIDTGMSHLFPDPARSFQPLKSSERLEKLRAYHAYLDKLEDLNSPEPEDARWEVSSIENFIERPSTDDTPTKTIFKVIWADGGKAWVPMDVLRLHDPSH